MKMTNTMWIAALCMNSACGPIHPISHAAVVGRGMGIPCVVGAEDAIEVNEQRREIRSRGVNSSS